MAKKGSVSQQGVQVAMVGIVAVVAIFIVLMNAVSTYRLTSNDNAVLSMVFQMVGIKDPIISQMLWTHYTTLHDFPL